MRDYACVCVCVRVYVCTCVCVCVYVRVYECVRGRQWEEEERRCTVEMSIKHVGQWGSLEWRHSRGIGQSGGTGNITTRVETSQPQPGERLFSFWGLLGKGSVGRESREPGRREERGNEEGDHRVEGGGGGRGVVGVMEGWESDRGFEGGGWRFGDSVCMPGSRWWRFRQPPIWVY